MPAQPIPSGIIVADLCILTLHRMLRSRTYWAYETAPADEQQLTEIADAIKTAFTMPLTQLLPEVHYFDRVECKVYGAGNSLFFANSTSASAVGALASPESPSTSDDFTSDTEDVMPDDTALIIQKKTGLRGRANQGRLFFGGLSERVNYAGQITDSFIGPARSLAATVNTDINVTGMVYTGLLHARHWNRKDNVMRPITKVYPVKAIGSRMDRRPRVLYERL